MIEKGKKQRAFELLSQGLTLDQVCLREGVNRKKMRRWLQEFAIAEDKTCLDDRAISKRVPFTPDQVQLLYDSITKNSVGEFYPECAFWTRNLVVDFVHSRLNSKYSSACVYRLLEQLGIHFPDPIALAFESNPRLIAEWTRAKLSPILSDRKRSSISLFAVGEVSLETVFRIERDKTNPKYSHVFRVSGPPTGQRLIFIKDLRKKRILFTVDEIGLGAVSTTRFLYNFRKAVSGPSMLFVPRKSEQFTAKLMAELTPHFEDINLIRIGR